MPASNEQAGRVVDLRPSSVSRTRDNPTSDAAGRPWRIVDIRSSPSSACSTGCAARGGTAGPRADNRRASARATPPGRCRARRGALGGHARSARALPRTSPTSRSSCANAIRRPVDWRPPGRLLRDVVCDGFALDRGLAASTLRFSAALRLARLGLRGFAFGALPSPSPLRLDDQHVSVPLGAAPALARRHSSFGHGRCPDRPATSRCARRPHPARGTCRPPCPCHRTPPRRRDPCACRAARSRRRCTRPRAWSRSA